MSYLKNIVDYGIIGVLILMSVLSLAIFIERILYFKKVDIKSFSSSKKLENSLTNNITIISTIGANAPYIGLLGTVIGIIITFYIMGESGNLDAKTIMKSLALALKATALGLLVAIPATILYNHLSRKIEMLLAKWDALYKK